MAVSETQFYFSAFIKTVQEKTVFIDGSLQMPAPIKVLFFWIWERNLGKTQTNNQNVHTEYITYTPGRLSACLKSPEIWELIPENNPKSQQIPKLNA